MSDVSVDSSVVSSVIERPVLRPPNAQPGGWGPCGMWPAGPGSSVVSGQPIQVNMVGEGSIGRPFVNPMGFMPGFQHPFDTEVLNQLKMPSFSGLPQDYAKFEKEWEQVERTARAMIPHPLNELSLLLRFKGCVDEATQRRLMVFLDPQLNPYPTLAKIPGRTSKGVRNRPGKAI